ncbi:thioesterase II family protein [Clostridium sporogenes]
MGSLLAYELYYKIYNQNIKMSKPISFSGYKEPSISRKEKQIYLLSDAKFIKEIIEVGGTPQEVVDNEELLQLFTPILRNDFKMLKKYFYK